VNLSGESKDLSDASTQWRLISGGGRRFLWVYESECHWICEAMGTLNLKQLGTEKKGLCLVLVDESTSQDEYAEEAITLSLLSLEIERTTERQVY